MNPNEQGYPAYVYDLSQLDHHVANIRAALSGIEFYYAVKANPDPNLLRVIARYVDGFEVASIGELAHIRSLFPEMPVAFGGPGKTDPELFSNVSRLHIESPSELARLLASGRQADILLRVNLAVSVDGAALTMGGGATPFGMDPDDVNSCVKALSRQNSVRLRGIHAHLASGLDAERMLHLAEVVVKFTRSLSLGEVNFGGGMAVSYAHPESKFDWKTYGDGLASLRQAGETFRIEPGRAVSVYCGKYVTQVIDVKRVHGARFAVVAGGTHHIRTPATKGHSQPMAIRKPGEPITIVGQLCTPKDILARDIPAALEPGDIVEFEMAGAYAWNISHTEFLMHPKPRFDYLGQESAQRHAAREDC